jgi:ABC-2 type transport system permease protein
MRAALLIARRELGGYLRSFSGYVIIAVVLALHGIFFNAYALGGTSKRSAEVLQGFFWTCFGFTAVAAVLISMRLLAEERQTGTIDLLYSSPVKDGEIVFGKYLSSLTFLALYLLATAYMPALVLVNGKISFGQIAAGYFGAFLVGSACLAIGIFGSSLARSQLVAAIASGCMVISLVISWLLAKVSDRPLTEIFSNLALYQQHFPPFERGLIHLRDVVYYLALTYLGLFAATRVLEARRWK